MGRVRTWDPKLGIVERHVDDAPRCPWPVLHERLNPEKELRPITLRVAEARACGRPALIVVAGVTPAGVGTLRDVRVCGLHAADVEQARAEGRSVRLIGDARR